MNDAHQMGKIQRTVGAFGPATIAAEELSRAAMSQQTLNWILEIHSFSVPANERKPKWGEAPKVWLLTKSFKKQGQQFIDEVPVSVHDPRIQRGCAPRTGYR